MAFYRRRTAEMPVPEELAADSPELGGLIPALPATWTAKQEHSIRLQWAIPPALRGKCLKFSALASADEVEPAFVSFGFEPAGSAKRVLLWKPYIYPEAGRDFFFLPIPPKAERCAIRLRFSKTAAHATLADFGVTILTPLDGVSWLNAHHREEQ
jgi:hypothetical protein